MATSYRPTKLPSNNVTAASKLMEGFSERTGLTGERSSKRYLWTDAFAVCNYISLKRETGEDRYRRLALDLVNSVHHVLGKHRQDSKKSGQWLSGLPEDEGQQHPTTGGLRIGKPLSDVDVTGGGSESDASEWDRDGQYYHYITRWMHTLDLITREMHLPQYNKWGVELAKAAYKGFVYKSVFSSEPRMYWKMNVDLSKPAVKSQGHHDPLDGYITMLALNSQAKQNGDQTLEEELETFHQMCSDKDWSTSDPLGIGCLLIDSYMLYQHLQQSSNISEQDHSLLKEMIRDADRSLENQISFRQFALPAQVRLGFRELGLAIGLEAVAKMYEREKQLPNEKQLFAKDEQTKQKLESLTRFVSRSEKLINFWRKPESRQVEVWMEHQDINDVMLATALVPSGFLDLPTIMQKGEQ